MSRFTDYWQDKLLNKLFDVEDFTPPTIYIGLSTGATRFDETISEPSAAAGYARVKTSASDWGPASEGVIRNVKNITFPQATKYWGILTHFALFDTADSRNVLAHGVLSQSEKVEKLDTARFQENDLDICLS